MTDFFEDPEVRALMAKAGIVHKPGLGQAHLDEIAPLLAADGIDMNNLDDDVDIDTLNAALARANERRNLELFTPVGVHRSGSLAVLRQCSEALAEGDDERLQAVLAGIDREPAGDTPAISHVIGVALAMLDGWHADPALRATRAPRWERSARAAATEILSLARKGRAFESLRSLIVRHRGLAVFRGGCLAVAAFVVARAKREGVPVAELAARIIVDGAPASSRFSAPAAPQGHSGAAFRRQPPAAPQADYGAPGLHTDRAVVRAFGAWLRRQPEIAAPSVEEETGMLEGLFGMARHNELDPHDADDILELFDVFFETDDPRLEDASGAAMATIDEFVHFRIETADDPAPWIAVHLELEHAHDDLGTPSRLADRLDPTTVAGIEAAIAEAAHIDPEERITALAQTVIVAAVDGFLAWLGSGRKITITGSLRRVDIEPVAAMLGIRAIGVASLPKPWLEKQAPEAPDQVQSMYDLPLLSAWWYALLDTELIETTATRVRPGPAAATWSSAEPTLEVTEMLAGVVVAHVIEDGTRLSMFADAHGASTTTRLLRAIAPDGAAAVETDDPDESGSLMAEVASGLALRTMHELAALGLLGFDGAGVAVVPVALRGTVARGMMLSLTLAAANDRHE